MTDVRNAIAHAVTDAVIDAARDPRTDTTAADAGIVSAAVIEQVAPLVAHATNNEPWYQSRVMWGSIVAIASPLLAIVLSWVMGDSVTISPAEQANIAAALAAAGSAVGGLLAIYGRFRATKPLGQ